jgi:16S rRNA (cytidine1402-2'-O)-methyltransferase
LTKPHQEIIRADLGTLAKIAAGRELKGEVTLVIGGAGGGGEGPQTMAQLASRALALIDQGERSKDAVDLVAGAANVPRRRLYQAVLSAKHPPGPTAN